MDLLFSHFNSVGLVEGADGPSGTHPSAALVDVSLVPAFFGPVVRVVGASHEDVLVAIRVSSHVDFVVIKIF